MSTSGNMVNIRLPEIKRLINIYGSEAHVDVPELVNLTLRALVSGSDLDYAFRTHGCHTDAPPELLRETLRDLYKAILIRLNEHNLNYLYSADLVKIHTYSITVLFEVPSFEPN